MAALCTDRERRAGVRRRRAAAAAQSTSRSALGVYATIFSCIGSLTYVASQRVPPEAAGGAAAGGAAASSGIRTDDVESLLFHSLSVA